MVMCTYLDEFLHIYPRKCYLDQNIKHFQHPRRCHHVPSQSIAPTRGNHYSDVYHHRLVLSTLVFHISGITQYVFICVWLFFF